MEPQQLKHFREVAEREHVTRAAWPTHEANSTSGETTINQQRPHSALADRTPDEFASAAMQLSSTLPLEKILRATPQSVFVLRGSSELL
jgi:hypothetical protein